MVLVGVNKILFGTITSTISSMWISHIPHPNLHKSDFPMVSVAKETSYEIIISLFLSLNMLI